MLRIGGAGYTGEHGQIRVGASSKRSWPILQEPNRPPARMEGTLGVNMAIFRLRVEEPSSSRWRCCSCCDRVGSRQTAAMRTRRPRSAAVARSAFAGFCFPPDVIVLAVRWYLRFALSYRDVEELLAERGVQVDHVTVYRWVQRFTPLLAEAARPCRHAVGDRWQVDETYVRVAGRWRYDYRAIDQFGQVIDVFVSPRRDAAAARRFFERALGATRITPVEIITDQAATYPVVLEELLPAAWHRTDRYTNIGVECDHGRLKARLGPMRGLKQDRSARVVIAGHGFVRNLRRGHYELAVEEPVNQRVAVAFDELALVI
jgi:transposase-like protein